MLTQYAGKHKYKYSYCVIFDYNSRISWSILKLFLYNIDSRNKHSGSKLTRYTNRICRWPKMNKNNTDFLKILDWKTEELVHPFQIRMDIDRLDPCCPAQNVLYIPFVGLSTVDGRAFSVASHRTWKSLPDHATSKGTFTIVSGHYIIKFLEHSYNECSYKWISTW